MKENNNIMHRAYYSCTKTYINNGGGGGGAPNNNNNNANRTTTSVIAGVPVDSNNNEEQSATVVVAAAMPNTNNFENSSSNVINSTKQVIDNTSNDSTCDNRRKENTDVDSCCDINNVNDIINTQRDGRDHHNFMVASPTTTTNSYLAADEEDTSSCESLSNLLNRIWTNNNNLSAVENNNHSTSTPYAAAAAPSSKGDKFSISTSYFQHLDLTETDVTETTHFSEEQQQRGEITTNNQKTNVNNSNQLVWDMIEQLQATNSDNKRPSDHHAATTSGVSAKVIRNRPRRNNNTSDKLSTGLDETSRGFDVTEITSMLQSVNERLDCDNEQREDEMKPGSNFITTKLCRQNNDQQRRPVLSVSELIDKLASVSAIASSSPNKSMSSKLQERLCKQQQSSLLSIEEMTRILHNINNIDDCLLQKFNTNRDHTFSTSNIKASISSSRSIDDCVVGVRQVKSFEYPDGQENNPSNRRRLSSKKKSSFHSGLWERSCRSLCSFDISDNAIFGFMDDDDDENDNCTITSHDDEQISSEIADLFNLNQQRYSSDDDDTSAFTLDAIEYSTCASSITWYEGSDIEEETIFDEDDIIIIEENNNNNAIDNNNKEFLLLDEEELSDGKDDSELLSSYYS